jgi:hypothetical protein
VEGVGERLDDLLEEVEEDRVVSVRPVQAGAALLAGADELELEGVCAADGQGAIGVARAKLPWENGRCCRIVTPLPGVGMIVACGMMLHPL